MKVLNIKVISLYLILRIIVSEYFKISYEVSMLGILIYINVKIGLEERGINGRMFSLDIIVWREVMEGSGIEKRKK